jgi:hypothetical protein
MKHSTQEDIWKEFVKISGSRDVLELWIKKHFIEKSFVEEAINKYEKNRGRWSNDYSRGYSDLIDHLKHTLGLTKENV